MKKISTLLRKTIIILSVFIFILSPCNVLAEDITTNIPENNVTEQEENTSTVDDNTMDNDYSYSNIEDDEDEVLGTNNNDSSPSKNNETNKMEENTDELEKEVSSGHSLKIILIEIFCGIIGVVMLVMANKTTE